MSGVELKPVDRQDTPIHVPFGKTTVGRGPFLGCTDKRISRNHAVLEVTDKGKLTLTPIHTNPCFKVNGKADFKPYTKDVAHFLSHGDRFSMLPSAYEYEVVITSEKRDRKNEDASTKKDVDAIDKQNRHEKVHSGDESKHSKGEVQNIPKDKVQSPLKDATGASTSSAAKPSRVEIAERKANNLLGEYAEPSTSKTTSRKRMLPGWLLDAAEQQGSGKQEKSPPKKTPPKRTSATKANASIKEDNDKNASVTKTKQITPRKTPEKKTNVPNKAKTVTNTNNNRSGYDLSESDDDLPSKTNKMTAKFQTPKAKSNYDMSDEESDDKSADKNQKAQAKKKKSPCVYGAKCYRKNPVHFKEFSHPGDDDYESDQGNSRDRSPFPADDSDDSRPECEFGLSCYRKNPQHRKDYKHTAHRQPQRAATKKAKAKNRRHNDDSNDEDEDSDDSFIDDDSDEYKPGSGDDSDDDPSLLLAEAEKFKRNKNLLKPV